MKNRARLISRHKVDARRGKPAGRSLRNTREGQSNIEYRISIPRAIERASMMLADDRELECVNRCVNPRCQPVNAIVLTLPR